LLWRIMDACAARSSVRDRHPPRKHLDETAFTEAWEQGWALTVDEAVALALASLK